MMMNVNFYSGDFELKTLSCEFAIVTGVCRSGKTTMSNLIGSVGGVENIDEPWLPMTLPVVSGLKIMGDKLAVGMFRSYVANLLNDIILLRTANFRKSDLSYTLNQITKEEIDYRMNTLKSRLDVKEYLLKNDTVCLLNLPEVMPFLNFFTKSIKGVKFVNVVRNGTMIAAEIEKKHWFSDEQLKCPVNAQLFKKFVYKKQDYYLPWWVDEEEFFIELSEYARGIYYWTVLMEKSVPVIDKLQQSHYMQIKYEDYIKDIRAYFPKIKNFLGISSESSVLTEQMLSTISLRREANCPYKKLPRLLENRFLNLMKHFEYD